MIIYQITLIKHVHSTFSAVSSDDVWLEKSFALPFPPFVGLTVSFGDFECAISTEAEIYYNLDSHTFKIYVDADKRLYNAAQHGRLNSSRLGEIVQDWIESGWERRAEQVELDS